MKPKARSAGGAERRRRLARSAAGGARRAEARGRRPKPEAINFRNKTKKIFCDFYSGKEQNN